MREIRFAQYRRYEARRVAASNAMMALLAGAGMASHLLQLTRGSQHLLPEVFPQVPHIGRLNLRSELARQILDAADVHLGAMSIPYALAIHDDFLRERIHLLVTARKCTVGQKAKAGKLAAKYPLIALRAPHFRRRARGLAKFHYPPLQLTDDELAEARNRCLGHQAAAGLTLRRGDFSTKKRGSTD